MAKKIVTVSDLDGTEIADADVVRVSIDTAEGRRFVAELSNKQVDDILAVATEVKKPGRKAS